MHCINVKQVKQIVACIVDTLHSISCSPVSVEVSVQIISQCVSQRMSLLVNAKLGKRE